MNNEQFEKAVERLLPLAAEVRGSQQVTKVVTMRERLKDREVGGIIIPCYAVQGLRIENLPSRQPDTVFIVPRGPGWRYTPKPSPNFRYDIASPGDLIRDEDGQVVGCRSLELI